MTAIKPGLDAKLTAIMVCALFGFMLSTALPVIKFPAIAQESEGTGIRVWRGTSQDADFGAAAEAAEEEEAEPASTATAPPAARSDGGIRVHAAGGRQGPSNIVTHRAGQPGRGVPTYRTATRHRAGHSSGRRITTHRAGVPSGGRINTHRAGQWGGSNIRTHRAGTPMRTMRVN